MKIFNLDGQYYCRTQCGFTLQKLEGLLDSHLKMRKGSFAEHYSKKIFRELFQYARDLKYEYQEYYREEYDDFTVFLYQKELWRHSAIDDLQLSSGETLLHLQNHVSSYNIESLLNYEDSSLDAINQVLKELPL